MLAMVQRVLWAEVEVAGVITARIDNGLLVYTSVGANDTPDLARKLAQKVAGLRIFDDEGGKLNLSVQDTRGGVLAVSNFTLLADTAKGRRPSFDAAAPAQQAAPVHQAFIDALVQAGLSAVGGVFRAHMVIRSAADGPVNVLVRMPPEDRGPGA